MGHIDVIKAAIISVLQGVSELFPVSSLGHAVLVPRLLHWNINEQSSSWLAFLVALHVGTAVSLLIYFREDWIHVFGAFVSSVQQGRIGTSHDERLAWMVVLGTIPAGFVGLVLEHPLRAFFASPRSAAVFLVTNGIIMYVGEHLIQRQQTTSEPVTVAIAVGTRGASARPLSGSHPVPEGRYRDITELSWRDATVVGLAQIGALFPGISRSGVTIVAGLAAGLTHQAAARYTFLLATPLIGAAGALEIPTLFEPAGRSVLGYALMGMVLAGISAYISIRFLMRYFEFGRLYPYAYYCVGAGLFSLALLSI
jgi:undecaprenyl-diphosphatase